MTRAAHPIPQLETALRDPVAAWLRAVLPHPVIVDELDGGYGIADLVGAAAPTLRTRRSQPLHEAIQLALVDYLTVPRDEDELRNWAPLGWRQLRARGLEPLLEAGVVEVDDAGRFCCAWVEHDPFDHMIAVELKLTNWRRAIAQAFRYRLFADLSYIAMPARPAAAAADDAANAGVGVLAIDGDDVIEIVAPEAMSLVAPTSRRLARERVLYALRIDTDRPAAGSPRGRRTVTAPHATR